VSVPGETAAPFDLSGRHALVAGATGELGRAVAVGLAEAGARVSVTTARDIAEEETVAQSILNECWSMARDGVAQRLDLTDGAAVASAAATLARDVAPVEILVNVAHQATVTRVLDASAEQWDAELAVNATAVFHTARAFGPTMAARGYGRIVNLVSVLHDRAAPAAGIYGASQAAVVALTRALGLELGSSGVTVNAVAFGFIEGVPGPHADPEAREQLERYVPLRRVGGVRDLQGAVVYLASEQAGFFDAGVLTVDGGTSIRS
jgi:NAD(P)-dependent dehydrogenase (short-subunit alcohol dehydrogenase family)